MREITIPTFDYTGKTVKLTEDIDLGGKAWAPLRVNAEMTFDGNGKTISNFTATGSKNVGFFGTATKATIRGLTVKNAKIINTAPIDTVIMTDHVTDFRSELKSSCSVFSVRTNQSICSQALQAPITFLPKILLYSSSITLLDEISLELFI